MARELVTLYSDDVTGQPGTDIEEVVYAVGGAVLECDMSGETKKRFDEALAPYTSVSRRRGPFRATPQATASAARKPTIDREQNQAIRDWAKRNGLTVSDRGRIPAEIVDRYHSEH